MSDSQKLLDDVLQLPEKERAEIAARLLESLGPPIEHKFDEEWIAEIERRCSAVDDGRAVTSDWNDVRERIERDIFGR